jgi:predicted Rossmann-fold nucleotide-binding protein
MIAQRTVLSLVCFLECGLVSAAAEAQDATSVGGATSNVELICTTDSREPRAWYVGPYKGFDSNLTGVDLARDLYCADIFKKTRYPNGFVTIYGSSRISEYFEDPKRQKFFSTSSSLAKEFNKTYAEVKTFANMWTRKFATKFPIMTGAGPGLMEAGSMGATEAGKSIGYTTYYAPPNAGDPHGYSDDPRFWRYPNPETKSSLEITSDGLVFSSVSARETAMILHSAAIVIAPGGSGTEWETFQILEMLKSKQLRPVPVYFIGEKYHWASLIARVHDMENRGTVKKGTLPIAFAACPTDLVNKLAFALGLSVDKPIDEITACANKPDYELRALKQVGVI